MPGLLVVPGVSLPTIAVALAIDEVSVGWSLGPVLMAAGAFVAVCLACLAFLLLGSLDRRLEASQQMRSDPACPPASTLQRLVMWATVGGVLGLVVVTDVLVYPGPHNVLGVFSIWLVFPGVAVVLALLSHSRHPRSWTRRRRL